MGVMFKTTDNVFDSVIRRTTFGFWEEFQGFTYENEWLDGQRAALGEMVFKMGQDFKSDDLEVIAFTWRYRQD